MMTKSKFWVVSLGLEKSHNNNLWIIQVMNIKSPIHIKHNIYSEGWSTLAWGNKVSCFSTNLPWDAVYCTEVNLHNTFSHLFWLAALKTLTFAHTLIISHIHCTSWHYFSVKPCSMDICFKRPVIFAPIRSSYLLLQINFRFRFRTLKLYWP